MSESTPHLPVTRFDLRLVARYTLGLFGTLFLLAAGFTAFGHTCAAGNKTFEMVAPLVLAAMALACVLVFRRIWIALLALVLLALALDFVSAWYLDSVHRGPPFVAGCEGKLDAVLRGSNIAVTVGTPNNQTNLSDEQCRLVHAGLRQNRSRLYFGGKREVVGWVSISNALGASSVGVFSDQTFNLHGGGRFRVDTNTAQIIMNAVRASN